MDSLEETLKTQFGLSDFRPGQREAITTLMQQKKLLCIQPTGFGKSLLYQLPAVLLPGMTVVISPLLALMQDQIRQLNHRFHIPAATINSEQSDEVNNEVEHSAKTGRIKILFISPEQLDRLDRLAFLKTLTVSLVVIDEAHSISTWGHDFRPSYRLILDFLKSLPKEVHVLALTATANQKTEKDIVKQLQTDERAVAVQRASSNRENIALWCLQAKGTAEKLDLLRALVLKSLKPMIIYCATRENTEMAAQFLNAVSIPTACYHAGLLKEEKIKLQELFLKDAVTIMTATNALGMGIDKPNIRTILHFDVPGSITAYYQEIGRSGRDGKPSQAILIFDPQDKKVHDYFIRSGQPTIEHFDKVYELIETPLRLTEIKQHSGLHPTLISVIMAELVEQGFAKKMIEGKGQYYHQLKSSLHGIDLTRYQNQYLVKTAELKAMLSYANESGQCLMSFLREHLGDHAANPCQKCATCAPKAPLQVQDRAAEKWLENRLHPIGKTLLLKEGGALLNSIHRSPLFMQFMKERQQQETLNQELWQLLLKAANTLHRNTPFAAIIPIPSRTWKAQKLTAIQLGQALKIPVIDQLQWNDVPEKRQGELLNNDQRKANVKEKLSVKVPELIPEGPLLLFDDYAGSLATLNEAARAIKKGAGRKNPLVPLTIATVKWRLGQAGLV